MFLEGERLHDRKHWSEENLWGNLNLLINSLVEFLKNETIAIYFGKKINGLKDIAKDDLLQTITNIEDFQKTVNDKLVHALKTGKRDTIT